MNSCLVRLLSKFTPQTIKTQFCKTSRAWIILWGFCLVRYPAHQIKLFYVSVLVGVGLNPKRTSFLLYFKKCLYIFLKQACISILRIIILCLWEMIYLGHFCMLYPCFMASISSHMVHVPMRFSSSVQQHTAWLYVSTHFFSKGNTSFPLFPYGKQSSIRPLGGNTLHLIIRKYWLTSLKLAMIMSGYPLGYFA